MHHETTYTDQVNIAVHVEKTGSACDFKLVFPENPHVFQQCDVLSWYQNSCKKLNIFCLNCWYLVV